MNAIDDHEEKELPSFSALKKKTMKVLYGIDDNHTSSSHDKSPKGCVDEPIKPLVDLINSHPSYTTLSSCSGRIALFDPNNSKSDDSGNERSGKGGGGKWLLAEHAIINLEQLERALSLDSDGDTPDGSPEDQNQPLMFKHEPMLLHIACANSKAARSLMQIALTNCGLRESGCVATPKRITVAIRSHALAMTVPLARSGDLRPNREYLRGLVKESNKRFHLNERKIGMLFREIKRCLGLTQELKLSFDALPALNMWGHATVLIPREDDGSDIFAIGGYGPGPNGNAVQPQPTKCTRSNQVYSLSQTNCGKWEDGWRIRENPDHGSQFPPREGHAMCVLPTVSIINHQSSSFTLNQQPLVAIFGGRASPTSPSNDLFFYHPNTGSFTLISPDSVRGKPPSPRWGHTFTALSGQNGYLAVIIGGRNETEALSSVHILSVGGEEGDSLLMWQELDFGYPIFHHAATSISATISTSSIEKIFIFGGLTDPLNLLQVCDLHPDEDISQFVLSFDTANISNTQINKVIGGAAKRDFGCSATFLPLYSILEPQSFIMLSGGVSHCAASDGNPLRVLCNVEEEDKDIITLDPCPLHIQSPKSGQELDLSAMIHHSSLAIPVPLNSKPDDDFIGSVILIGGGVAAFAFGPVFSGSYRVSLFKKQTWEIIPNATKGDPRTIDAPLDATTSKTPERPEQKATAKLPSPKCAAETDVLYVTKRNAKPLKNALEARGYLDKAYRMTPAEHREGIDPRLHVAVPVTKKCVDRLGRDDSNSVEWFPLVVGVGVQEVRYSSAMLGRQRV